MKQKFELSLTSGYANTWGVQESLRELIQNAIDQEKQVEDNDMSIEYDGNNKLIISNKNSVLQKKTLLLGYTSKENDEDTIGQFGEGYKIALLVLTRLGYNVTIYNYGKREVWTSKLVKSRRYEGEKVLTIYVETEHIWKKIPNNNLTIEIEGINIDIYKELIQRCLHLQSTYKKNLLKSKYGNILLDDKFKGKLFVNGLFIGDNDELSYGYDILPKYLNIGRDRDLVNSYDIYHTTSRMWKEQNNFRLNELIDKDALDVRYIVSDWRYEEKDAEIGEKIYVEFKEKHGDKAIPVSTQEELVTVNTKYANATPILVNSITKRFIDNSCTFQKIKSNFVENDLSIEDKYKAWKDKWEWKWLSSDGIEELDEIFNEFRNKIS
ncbi:Uncharacterised protein [[Clostridium] sordellii]|uniref:hypothetical protein n=1 Tax=Paraclostridium sordellii TaxID=1505 RepID=UPI0005E73AEA|nr:hypothetical protein [Paeniclostridium sordellii]CEQ01598.1 Uncharacterised protein [[Clostridium] sordellii] [Paeniclostridium sordellii]